MAIRNHGYTLLEIAVVLVIIGLLLGGVLKGQELITGARVRNVIDQQSGIKAAYFGFVDRYRARPGDYSAATANIPNLSAAACNGGNGDGDGIIEADRNENTLVWEHLSKAGFLNGVYTCAAAVSAATTPMNPYARPIDLAYDADYGGSNSSPQHNLKTGSQVPAEILAEVDRKVDDGNALTGSVRAQTSGGVTATTTECYDAGGAWAPASGGANCGAATLL